MRPPDSRPQIDVIITMAPVPRCLMCGAAGAETHATALGDQRARACQTEPAARPGDDGDLVGETQIHCLTSLGGAPLPFPTSLAPAGAYPPCPPPVRSLSFQSMSRNAIFHSFFW